MDIKMNNFIEGMNKNSSNNNNPHKKGPVNVSSNV